VRSPGQATFLFDVSYTQILEIVSGIPHIELPAAPRHTLVMIAWRKRPVAVVDAGALFGLDPVALCAGGRLLIARSPRWQAPVAIPIGDNFHTRALPLPHRPCRRTLPFDPTHARGVFEIDGDRVLVLPDVDAIARPATASR
jgi:chemotaxis signal transduction protein